MVRLPPAAWWRQHLICSIYPMGLLLLVTMTSMWIPASLPPLVEAAPLWLQQPGAMAIYRKGPLVDGELQTGSLRITVMEANTTHTTLQIEGYSRSTGGWINPTLHEHLPQNRSTTFWLAQNAEIGSPLHDLQFRITRPIANMTPAVDKDDAGGPGTWQEGVRATVKRLTGLQLYELTVLYDTTCHLALEFTRRYHTGIFIITENYYLHQTNIDLGPSVVTHQLVFVAAITTVTLLILGGVPLLIIRVADHLQKRHQKNSETEPKTKAQHKAGTNRPPK